MNARAVTLDREPIAVLDVAVRNGLGTSARETWAYKRATLTAFVGSPFRHRDGGTVTMAPVRQLDPRSYGTPRMVELVRATLRDLKLDEKLPRQARLGVFLGVAPRYAKGRGIEADRTRARLEQVVGEVLAELGFSGVVLIEPRGHASFAHGVLDAVEAFSRRTCDVVIAGGVDTSYDPLIVEELLDADRLLKEGSLDATIPGEGAGFAVLAPLRARLGPPIAIIEAVATDMEPATIDNDVPCLGLGLSRPCNAVTKHLREQRRTVDWYISDLTPEHYRTTELALVWPRISQSVAQHDGVLDYVCTHTGDIGAATMPTTLAIATVGFEYGDPLAETCLITGSSDDGHRGAVLLSRAR